MSVGSKNQSVAEILHYSLTTQDKHYVENYRLAHQVLLGIGDGVPGDILHSVATHIPKQLLAGAIGTSLSNLGRLSKKNLNRYQSDALIDLSSLWYELRQFFNFNDSSVREWIDTPLPALDGVAPGHLMTTIAGRNELRKLLNTMRSGDF
jgi:uncharacterized protein (DUF2384 family)